MMLDEVLAQQTTIINKLRATELLWAIESKGKDSAQTSNEEARKVVKPIGPRAEPREKANTCRIVRTTSFRAMLHTTNSDGNNVRSLKFDSPQYVRVCMATRKGHQHADDISISADEDVSSFTSDDFASSPRTEAPADTSPFPDHNETQDQGIWPESCEGKIPSLQRTQERLR